MSQCVHFPASAGLAYNPPQFNDYSREFNAANLNALGTMSHVELPAVLSAVTIR
jgi:hypothetical protein